MLTLEGRELHLLPAVPFGVPVPMPMPMPMPMLVPVAVAMLGSAAPGVHLRGDRRRVAVVVAMILPGQG